MAAAISPAASAPGEEVQKDLAQKVLDEGLSVRQTEALARRLADTLADSLPGMLPKALLADQKTMLFGSPMSSGGLCGALQDDLEALLFL